MFGDLIAYENREHLKKMAEYCCALAIAMLDKGIMTLEEWKAYQMQGVSVLEQATAELKEEQLNAMSEKERKSYEFWNEIAEHWESQNRDRE